MEDNKYYVPTIEEFYIGFEYEALNSRDWFFSESEYGWKKMKWEPRIGSLNQGIFEIDGAIKNGWIRVPYLRKEDIEAEGWAYIDEGEYGIDAYYSKKIEFSQSVIEYRLRYWGLKSHKLTIWSEDTDSTYFDGEVKNASEFKRILKMIGV